MHKPKQIKKHESAIKKAVGIFDLEEIYEAICNYKNVLNSDLHYFNYKWTLTDFLNRGLDKFIEDADPLNNFLVKKIQSNQEQPTHNYQEL